MVLWPWRSASNENSLSVLVPMTLIREPKSTSIESRPFGSLVLLAVLRCVHVVSTCARLESGAVVFGWSCSFDWFHQAFSCFWRTNSSTDMSDQLFPHSESSSAVAMSTVAALLTAVVSDRASANSASSLSLAAAVDAAEFPGVPRWR